MTYYYVIIRQMKAAPYFATLCTKAVLLCYEKRRMYWNGIDYEINDIYIIYNITRTRWEHIEIA